jgi:hypothetical protein
MIFLRFFKEGAAIVLVLDAWRPVAVNFVQMFFFIISRDPIPYTMYE